MDVAHLRTEAMRARDEHGNTDFYALLNEAADEIARLRTVLELIAGSSADRLQALQARAALDNIGAKIKRGDVPWSAAED